MPSCLRKPLLITLFFFISYPCHIKADEHHEDLFKRGVQSYDTFTDKGIEESISFFEKALEKSPDFAPAYAALAESYVQKYFRNRKREKEFLRSAFRFAEKALLIDARLPEAHKALASVYFAKGKMKEAIEEIERAVDMRPEYARAWLNLGTCWLERGDRIKAAEFFRKAVELDNDRLARGISYYNIASLQAEEERHDDALSNYREAEKSVPAYYNIHYGLGVVLMHLGRDEEAVQSFKKAAGLKPDHADSHLGLASAYHRLKRREEAITAYERALELDPDLEEAISGLMALTGRKFGIFYLY